MATCDIRRPFIGPDFLCVGAQKAGTRWLYDQLQHHPDFWMPPIKELHYFSGLLTTPARAQALHDRASRNLTRTNHERTTAGNRALEPRDLEFLAAYLRLIKGRQPSAASRIILTLSSRAASLSRRFAALHRDVISTRLRPQLDFSGYADLFVHKSQAITGDISPEYSTLSPATVREIVTSFPGVKVVFLARDPVERLWSALHMYVRRGYESWPENVKALERLLRKANFAERSYQTQIAATWQQSVPASCFGVFLFDDLRSDAANFRRRLVRFLGGDPARPSGTLSADFNRKTGLAKRPMPPAFREALGRLFTEELCTSARQFGGAACRWPAKYGL